MVLRHAKAEQVGATDFERELMPRGRDDAAAVGVWLAAQGVSPDAAVVSGATRTRQTWEHVCRGAGWDLEPTLDTGLYAGGTDTALDVIRGLDDSVSCAVFVGHNPTTAYLAQLLDDGEGDVEAGTAMLSGYPTSAATVLTFATSWTDLAPAGARLVGFHVGRAG